MSIDYSRQLHRLMRIVTLVRSGGAWTPATLAEELGVDERTFHRYRAALVKAGVPVRFDRRAGGYRIDDDFFLPPLQLTATEALALAALCEDIALQEQIPGLREAGTALEKIRAALPAALRDEVDRHARDVSIRTGPVADAGGADDVLNRLRASLAARRIIACRYESNRPGRSDDDEWFGLAPYALFYSRRAWYVVGRRSDRDALRTLRVNRFADARPTDETYAIPDDFSLEAHFGNAWEMIRGDDVDVELVFGDPTFATTATETQWHPTQEFQWQEDGSCVMTFTVAGLDEIEWWILGWGEHCVVRQPPELADRVRAHAERMQDAYRRDTS